MVASIATIASIELITRADSFDLFHDLFYSLFVAIGFYLGLHGAGCEHHLPVHSFKHIIETKLNTFLSHLIILGVAT